MSSNSRMSGGKGVSYTFGVPGSRVTLNISKDGNRSLVLSRGSNSKASESSSAPVPAGQRRFPDGWVGPANTPFCKVCWDAGLPVAEFTSHYVKDQPGPDGKVVCPTLLAQKCLDCGVAGHTSGYCPKNRQLEREHAERERQEHIKQKKANSGGWETVGEKNKPKARIEGVASSSEKMKIQEQPQPKATLCSSGAFAVLAESSSEEEEEPTTVQPTLQQQQAKPLTWAQRAAMAATATAVPKPSSKPSVCSDTRYQLHVLCERIEMDSRCAKRQEKKVNPREAAANVATESSMKRKQDAVSVPA